MSRTWNSESSKYLKKIDVFDISRELRYCLCLLLESWNRRQMRQFHLMIHQVSRTCSYFHTYGCLHQCQYTMNFVRFLWYFHVLPELFKTSHPFLLHSWSSRRPYSWQIYILKHNDQTSDNHNIKFEIFHTICLYILSSCRGSSFLIVFVGEIWISSMVSVTPLKPQMHY